MDVRPSLNRSFALLASLVSAAVLCPAFQAPAAAQYLVTNLDSNLTNAVHMNDKDLINAWGVAYFPGAPFWVSDEGTGKSTLYDGSGNKQALVVKIPPASGSGHGLPTGKCSLRHLPGSATPLRSVRPGKERQNRSRMP